MKLSGKMSLMIILKVTKNQGFTLCLEDTVLEKPQGGRSNWPPHTHTHTHAHAHTHTPSHFRVNPVHAIMLHAIMLYNFNLTLFKFLHWMCFLFEPYLTRFHFNGQLVPWNFANLQKQNLVSAVILTGT